MNPVISQRGTFLLAYALMFAALALLMVQFFEKDESLLDLLPTDPDLNQGIMLVLFQDRDCVYSLPLIELANDVQREGRISVFGRKVATENNGTDHASTAVLRRVRFPYENTEPGRILHALEAIGFSGTPIILLFDRSRRLRMIIPSEAGYQETRRQITYISGGH